jgi:SsrA-binding protein
VAYELYLKNKRATYEFAIEDKLIVGMVLTGSEIKSIRGSKVSFNDAYCLIQDGELWIKSLHISEYANAGYASHVPTRERKLLLKKKELRKWAAKVREKGFSIIPLSLFINEKGYAKMEIGLGRGKKLHDKRDSIKARENARDMQRGE